MLGYVTVPRLETDLLGDEQEIAQTHRGAWLWLFDKAAWKNRVDRIGRFTVSLKRGEIACSLRFLARAWNWSHGRVQRWLNLLAARGKITLRNENGIIVIALGGYESTPESQKINRAADARPVDDQQPSQRVEEKNQPARKDSDSRSRPVRRFAARVKRAPEVAAKIRDLWIAKLGRYAAARGVVGEFWRKAMDDDPQTVARYLNELDERMKRERWNDRDEQHQQERRRREQVNNDRIRRWSFTHSEALDHV
jgi:hypothetical protein